MEEKREYLGLLGINFQIKLLGELMIPNNINKDTQNSFFDEVIDLIDSNYFEKMDMRRIMSLIKEYYQKFKIAPNMDNILEMIISLNTSDTEKEELKQRLVTIKDLWSKYKTGAINNDRDFIKNKTLIFIKQQEFSNVQREAEEHFRKGVVDAQTIYVISEKYKKIIDIGSPESVGDTLFARPDELLVEDYRDPIGIGNSVIDAEIDGGISKGEMCFILAGQGSGKTGMLTYIANNGYLNGKNVLHVILEGNKKDIRRRHYSKLFKVKTSEFHLRKEYILECLKKLEKSTKVGNLVIEKLKDMTPNKFRKWVNKIEQKLGYKFDMICLDYIDCLRSDDKVQDRFYSQELIAQDLEKITDEEQWRLFAGIQAKKEANGKRILTLDDIYGSAERGKKCHLLLTIGRDIEQNRQGLITIHNAKCRFTQSGQVWEDCRLNGDFLTLDVNSSNVIVLKDGEMQPPMTDESKSSYSNEASNSNRSLLTNVEI